MHRLIIAAAALTLSMSPGVARAGIVSSAVAALSPYTATRLGNRPRSVRTKHCERKADSIRVQGRAREIYMRKCSVG